LMPSPVSIARFALTAASAPPPRSVSTQFPSTRNQAAGTNRAKTLGTLFSVPSVLLWLKALSVSSLRPSLLSSWLPFDLFSLSIFHGLEMQRSFVATD
jgi:hypothetical protein